MKQMVINFDASPFDSYGSCREYVQRQVHHQKAPHKAIAMDMDYAPSKLTRKLAQADNCRFTLDDLEKFMAVTGDVTPIYYLLEKYVTGDDEEAIRKQIESLQAKLPENRVMQLKQTSKRA